MAEANDLEVNADIHDAMEDVPSNRSENREFGDVLQANLSRRRIVQGSVAGAAGAFLAPAANAGWKGWEDDDDDDDDDDRRGRKGRKKGLVEFREVSIDQGTQDQSMPTISDDYEYQVLIPWGTPIEPGATEEYDGDPHTRPTPEQAEKQIGIGHDGMWFFPIDTRRGVKYGKYGYRMSSSAGMLCINHEFGRNTHVLGKAAPESLADVRLSQAVHGVSVVAIKKSRGRYGEWEVCRSKNSRRITVNTPMSYDGPAANSPRLQNANGNVPLGTVNNCGSGPTPWGTYLTCEENFNGYFGYNDPNYVLTEDQDRYGFSENGFGYGWHNFDKRFDISDPEYANEYLRFGWVVEIDPFDGTQTPVKHTAMGRFKHEAVAVREIWDGGRCACYMGDDQRFDYCYKFVTEKGWRAALRDGESPLEKGTLYVARFNDDGTGDWLELSPANPTLANWSIEDILLETRLAADAVGATKMDRPEWTTIGKNGEVYWTLTNNSQRTVADAANPEAPNSDGHIIRTVDSEDGLGTTFDWDIYILASSTRGTDGVFTDPDAAWSDPDGRLFIGTDGGQPDGLQDQLTVFDTTSDTPTPRRLLVGVPSDEVTGLTATPDYRTLFTNLQHPGNGDPASGTSFPAPATSGKIPRDATLVITHKRNRVVGS